MGPRGHSRPRHRRRGALTTTLGLLTAGLGTIGAPPVYAAELSPCVVPDNGRPQIHEVRFSPVAVDVSEAPAQVTLRMHVADTGGPGPATGVQSVGPPIAGVLTCRDGAGSATSCEDGKVREVTWTADEPLAPGSYRLSINPDGVLDVTDMRGNPVERDNDEPEDFFEFRVLG